jgi:ABC-type bacteriocin/lantibiotic exporter with double-glycine peptidase domain
MLLNMETIKAMAAEDHFLRGWKKLFAARQEIASRQGLYDAWWEAIQMALRIAAPLGLLMFGTLRVINGEMSLGQMLSVTGIAATFLAPLSRLASLGTTLQMIGRSLDRLDDVLSTAPEFRPATPTPSKPLTGRIRIEAASFRYSPLAPLAVHNASIDIIAGEFVALVGPSGSGKSTLARLLLGLYSPTSGRVLYDGLDLATLDARLVRRNIGVVTQNSHLFNDTVRANIALANSDMELPDIIRAAKIAEIHDEIVSLPYSYDTILGPRGTALSAGQQQRLAIARALASNPSVLLLDEATSQLDAVNEFNVFHSLQSLRCTRIVIAHRLNSIVGADRILVVSQGEITEQGSHHELLSLDGHYAALVAASGRH